MKAVYLISLLCLLMIGSQATNTYVYTFDTVRRYYSWYSLGYVLSAHTVKISMTTPGVNSSVALSFANAVISVEPDNLNSTDTPVNCSALTCTTTTECYITCDILVSALYRFNITM